ncbi:efflux RND transporter periplasmic adaptor subunit [Agrococcus jejuensis]|uniref:efflux RND transporter periplasmic adaptor subunit n=1 Tax=Agrococcus jejuensis TaxID=399736 RepID=UPI001642EA64|nr:efflux RND transporter periplasmic adaptor subunit [Agrococcus jejuensis]
MSADDGRIDEVDGAATPEERPQHAADDRRAAAAQRRLEAAERKASKRAERQSRGPGVWRTIVWPVLRLAVFAVIAVALVKVAFFPDPSASEAGVDLPPTASMEEPLVAAAVGTVRNDLSLTGQVLPDDAVAVRSTQTGTVSRILASNGQGVSAGSELYVVRVETQATQPNEDGSLPAPTVRLFTITSPAAGVLTGFEVLLNQELQVGTETGSVQPATFHVDAPLTAQEQYRLTTQPTEAQVQIPGGPAPFTCTSLQVLQPATGSSGGATGGEGATGVSTATARCQVPGEVRVFSGLAADVTIAGGVAEGVLTLPTTAVLGSADTGRVVRIGADGAQEEAQVELGLTDGQTIEIRSGLAEGEQVLQFVPGGEPIDDPCADPMSPTFDPMLCGEVAP